MEQQLNVNLITDESGEVPEIVYRTGQAMPLREKLVIALSGDIKSIGNFLSKRTFRPSFNPEPIEGGYPFSGETLKDALTAVICNSGTQMVDPSRAVVIVDKEAGAIVLKLDPENHYGASVAGELKTSKELGIFAINEAVTYSREQLIKLIRFNRQLFENEERQAALLQAFQKFSVKVYCDLEKESDNRGNVSGLFKQVVNSNVPLNFNLQIPIYKGFDKEIFNVEICIEANGSSVQFYFESVELKELLDQRKEEIFAGQLEYCKEFPIIFK